jgi:hypothetical protein
VRAPREGARWGGRELTPTELSDLKFCNNMTAPWQSSLALPVHRLMAQTKPAP